MTSPKATSAFRWGFLGGALAAAAVLPQTASAEVSTGSKPASGGPRPPIRSLEPSTHSESHAPAAVQLFIDAPTTYGPWTMRLSNEGDVPVRVVADARLLVLEVTPRGAHEGVLCKLPDDMRATESEDRDLVLPPKRSYTERFEPRLYCFGAHLRDLSPVAIVVGHFGASSRSAQARKTKGPFVVTPIAGVEPEVTSLSSIDSLPIAVPDEPTANAIDPVVLRETMEQAGVPRLWLRGAVSVDSSAPDDIAVPVTLRNDGTRRVIVRFRPEALGFDVMALAGIEHCVWPGLPAAPMRELYTALAPNETASLTVLLNDYCHGHALDQGGLAVVRPWLDTRRASGAALGLHTFDGRVIATAPTLVRLHKGAAAPPGRRPSLDPVTLPSKGP